MKNLFHLTTSLLAFAGLLQQDLKAENLIPTEPGTAPNYFCTWNVQGYVLSYEKGKLRDAMTEQNMFGPRKHQGWVNFYPRIRSDLYFVMDDSWDVDFKNYDYGTDILNPERFPTYASSGTEQEKFKKLNDAVQAKGWRAVGGWIAANKAKAYKDMSDHDFFAERLKWMEAAGWGYLKVDWGTNSKSAKWRRQLTEWGHQYAPGIHVEQAMIWSCVPFSDVFRTYDIEVITSIPVTLSRVCDGIKQVGEPNAKALINCEDEPVIGAALGCAIGIMRHPFAGDLPDGKQDFAFPPVTRDVKRSLNEVERGVLWHRVAPPFKVDGKVNIDEAKLTDTWIFEEREGWETTKAGTKVSKSAPARITRGGLPLPTVKTASGEVPYVIASRHPNGALTIATLGRTLCPTPKDRKYGTPLADITLESGKLTGPIGIFGHYSSLTLTFDGPLKGRTILAQDILDKQARDITSRVVIKDNSITIPGKLIDQIGLEKADRGDKSDPGMVISISGAERPVAVKP
ncbi:MAG: hypothetical protein EOP88_04620 [Verrucomicrobiaceae bacterium]|nr:MAG: hypothetical protein EOP88_04620 [Verrucomicrobiaceae bacterium]